MVDKCSLRKQFLSSRLQGAVRPLDLVSGNDFQFFLVALMIILVMRKWSLKVQVFCLTTLLVGSIAATATIAWKHGAKFIDLANPNLMQNFGYTINRTRALDHT